MTAVIIPMGLLSHDFEDSTAIERAEYSTVSSELTVYFTGSDKGYQFDNVPRYVYDEWTIAESAGRYYNAVIKPYADKADHTRDAKCLIRGKF